MEHVVVAALNGLVVGASIALIAAGLALLFGVLGILNFAQGDFFMLGAYVVWLGVGHGLDSFLQRNDLVITSHYHHRSELKSLSQMHCADGNVAANNIYIAIE